MDLRNIPLPDRFSDGDEYIMNFLFPHKGGRKFGKLRDIRRLAAEKGISDVMAMGRDELLLSITNGCGWEEVYNTLLPDLGFPRSYFLRELNLNRNEFQRYLEAGEIRKHGSYRYTKFGKSQYSPVYDIYDFYKIKNEKQSERMKGGDYDS